MNKFLQLIMVLFFNNAIAYASSYPDNLTGLYHCNGSGVSTHQSFSCTMPVRKTNQTYAVNAICNDHTRYIGTGIYDQSKHLFSVVFKNPYNYHEVGLIISTVTKEGQFNSTWTYLGKKTVSTGHCAKIA